MYLVNRWGKIPAVTAVIVIIIIYARYGRFMDAFFALPRAKRFRAAGCFGSRVHSGFSKGVAGADGRQSTIVAGTKTYRVGKKEGMRRDTRGIVVFRFSNVLRQAMTNPLILRFRNSAMVSKTHGSALGATYHRCTGEEGN